MYVLEAAILDLVGVVHIIIALGFIWLNKLGSDLFAKASGYDPNHLIEEESNLAVALRRSGLYLGIALGMSGVLIGPSKGLMLDIMAQLKYGAMVSLLFVGARIFNDLVILRSMGNTKEIKEGNVAVGLVEFGAYVATGLIAMASMIGESGGPLTALAFFVIGQLILWLVVVAYESWTPWNVIEEVKKGNPACGLLIGSLMIAVSIALFNAVSMEFRDWTTTFLSFSVHAVAAVAIMLVLSVSVDRIFFTGTNIETEVVRDQNVAAILVVTSIKIVGALMICFAI